MALILASASPRRAELLAQIGYQFEVIPADINERPLEGELAEAYVQRMAKEKAEAIVAGRPKGDVVIGSDTSVIVDGDILGKPLNRADAKSMLQRLANRSHWVLTSVYVIVQGGSAQAALSRSEVHFGQIEAAAIERYLETGEADDKAGAYGIQGRAAAFIRHLSGSYSGVMGLPLYETAALLRAAGVNNE
ncbi:septum formation inhibitor Maf [Spongiibacter sp. KMU-158]|uniref:dTTP/UTP pyrophosphatase n=1 Tax=Spongiibacter pelagi TaxID=2760804 RepID=A0A927GWB4_9GAMM|nr:Maf family protein [Spongiibacter pelagi]MBD2858767.1 septum formation inhibitor Maf [Spongiibacter pelagi]